MPDATLLNASLFQVNFRDANLLDTDFTDVIGLKPWQLAGADVNCSSLYSATLQASQTEKDL